MVLTAVDVRMVTFAPTSQDAHHVNAMAMVLSLDGFVIQALAIASVRTTRKERIASLVCRDTMEIRRNQNYLFCLAYGLC